jgi:Uma2 family endonuclease
LIIRDSHVPNAFNFLHQISVSCREASANSTGTTLASSSSGRRYNAGVDGSDPMAPTAHSDRRLTYDDFLQFPECDGLRHEIIDGVHYVTPCPSLRHQDLVGRLHLALGNHLAVRPGLGRVFLSPLDVIFTIHDIVEPDLLFVASDQLEIMTEKNIQGAPAIVVEVVSKTTRRHDERIKRELFDRGGVREYWIVDPERSQVQVYRREGSRLDARISLSATENAVLTTPHIPGFALSVSELFTPSV